MGNGDIILVSSPISSLLPKEPGRLWKKCIDPKIKETTPIFQAQIKPQNLGRPREEKNFEFGRPLHEALYFFHLNLNGF